MSTNTTTNANTNTNTNRGFNHNRGRGSNGTRQQNYNNYNIRGGSRGSYRARTRSGNGYRSQPQYTPMRVIYRSRTNGQAQGNGNDRPGLLGDYPHGHDNAARPRRQSASASRRNRDDRARERHEAPSPAFSSSSSTEATAKCINESPGTFFSASPEGVGTSAAVATMSVIMTDTILKNFRSLECEKCQEHFGYQARTARYRAEAVFCSATCAESQLMGKENGPHELEVRPQPRTPNSRTMPVYEDALYSRSQVEANLAKARVPLICNVALRRTKPMPVPEKVAEIKFSRDASESDSTGTDGKKVLEHFTGEGFRNPNPSIDTVPPTSRGSAKENEATTENSSSRNFESQQSSCERPIPKRHPFPSLEPISRQGAFSATGGLKLLPKFGVLRGTSDVANLADFDDEPAAVTPPDAANEAKPKTSSTPLPLRPPIEEPSFTAPRRVLLPRSTLNATAPVKTVGTNGASAPRPIPAPAYAMDSIDSPDRVSRNYVAPAPPLGEAEEKKSPLAHALVTKAMDPAPAPTPAAAAVKCTATSSAMATSEAGQCAAVSVSGPATVLGDREEVTIYPTKRLTRLSKNLEWGRPLNIGLQLVVQRAHANSPLDIYVQTSDQCNQAGAITTDLHRMLQEGQLNRQGLTYDVGSICVAPYMGDHYRAEIVRNDPSSELVQVFFSDFGNDEAVNKGYLYSMPAKYRAVPRLIYHCQWDLGATKEMSEQEKMEIYTREVLEITPIAELRPGQYVIRIGAYRPRTKVNISLVEKPTATASASVPPSEHAKANRSRPMLANHPLSEHIDTNSELGIVFTWSLTRYMIGSSKDDARREEMNGKLNNKAPGNLEPYRGVPIVGELVIGLYEGDLYRAVVREVKDDNVKLEFIDYGDICVNKIKDLYFLNEEILAYPRFGLNINLDTTGIKKVVKTVTKQIEEQTYKIMTVEFTSMNKDRPDEFNAVFWINPQQTFNSMFEERTVQH